MTTSLVCCPL